jgi:hypothetical protein
MVNREWQAFLAGALTMLIVLGSALGVALIVSKPDSVCIERKGP